MQPISSHWIFGSCERALHVSTLMGFWLTLCDNDAILLASDWSYSHFCLAFFSCFDLILTPLPFCYCKKQTDASFSCVCPVIDHEFRHKIVKVADVWKTNINLLIRSFVSQRGCAKEWWHDIWIPLAWTFFSCLADRQSGERRTAPVLLMV